MQSTLARRLPGMQTGIPGDAAAKGILPRRASYGSSFPRARCAARGGATRRQSGDIAHPASGRCAARSEEHTSELQSQSNLVCRLLLEKKKKKKRQNTKRNR